MASLASSQRSRTAAHRRLIPWALTPSLTVRAIQTHSRTDLGLFSYPLQPSIRPYAAQLLFPLPRLLHISAPQFQRPQPADDVTDPPRQEHTTETKTDPGEATGPDKDRFRDEKAKKESSESKQESKEDPPPPPPHGDKSAWQVFTETLRTEFKASKEWNESTKQLASSAHQFTESESVKRARAAYDATAGAATSKTAEALKTTGKALGQGAAWTWDTKVVQGVRGGVNATGRGIEKATRPVRKTKAFQSIKEAVDDGSSSRYGGWVEKEERRKKKELRELQEIQSGRRPAEKMEEDPKYDVPLIIAVRQLLTLPQCWH